MTNAFSLIKQWKNLPAPVLEDFVGDLRAEFVAPLKHVAPAGLSLVGLPRWHGKRFEPLGLEILEGVNLVRVKSQPDAFEERLNMRAEIGASLVDRQPALIVTYERYGPRPWRWVRDEFRVLEDGKYVGMSFVDLPVLRKVGLPFLITKQP